MKQSLNCKIFNMCTNNYRIIQYFDYFDIYVSERCTLTKNFVLSSENMSYDSKTGAGVKKESERNLRKQA